MNQLREFNTSFSTFFSRKLLFDSPTILHKSIVILLSFGGITLEFINYRLFALYAKVCGSFIKKNTFCIAELNSDSKFIFDLNDFYWNRLVSNKFSYEPEIFTLLTLFKNIDYTFVDCGANLGYWSILTSSKLMGSKKVITIEAVPETFQFLSRNLNYNRRDSILLNNAIFSKSQQELTIYYKSAYHAGASLNKSWVKDNENSNIQTATIKTITLDDILYNANLHYDIPVVIKLDVEDVEIDALEGFKTSSLRKPAIIFEEYGGKKGAKVVEFVLNNMNLEVFYINENSRLSQVKTVKEAVSLKKNPTMGYNFVGVSKESSFYSLIIAKMNS